MNKANLDKLIIDTRKASRGLEKARIEHLLFNGSINAVLDELSLFQNKDGGFAHSLEPDIWNPHSSPIQSWSAITILRQLEMDSSHEITEKLFSYFENSFNVKTKKWFRLDPTNNNYPHAPWWGYQEGKDDFNPSASLAGYIVKHASKQSTVYKYAKLVIDDAFEYLKQANIVIEMHELRCFFEMFNDLPTELKAREDYSLIKEELLRHLKEIMEKDKERWFDSYCCKPSTIIKSHPTLGSTLFYDLMHQEFDVALTKRNDEGLWDITWSWTHYQKESRIATKAWQGIIGFDYLYLMKQFNYI